MENEKCKDCIGFYGGKCLIATCRGCIAIIAKKPDDPEKRVKLYNISADTFEKDFGKQNDT